MKNAGVAQNATFTTSPDAEQNYPVKSPATNLKSKNAQKQKVTTMKSENEMELEKKKTSMEIELEFELSQEEARQ